MVQRLTPTLAICCAATAFAVGAAIADWGADSTSQPPAAVAADGTPSLTIENFAFSALSVPAGATVEVVNRDGAPHTVTAGDGAFDTKVIDGGATASFVAPSDPGEHRFACNIHASMQGVLTVT
jgi:plastocyanin